MSNTRALEYDKTKFKQFLTGHCLPQLRDKSGVLVLGPMGAGKSTTIAIQLGAIYDKDLDNSGYKLISSRNFIPQTASGFTSKTLNIGAYEDPETRFMYLDTAGLNENRGKEEKLWTGNNLGLLFSIIKEFKAIVVVMDYSATFSGRGVGFETLAEELAKITMHEPIFYESMVFVITNAYKQGLKLSLKTLVADAENMLAETEKKTGELLSDASVKDNKKSSKEDEIALNRIQATKILLESLTRHSDRVVLSYPDGQMECQKLRAELLNKIKLMPVITKERLLEIKSKHIQDSSLLLFEVICSLAADYLPKLSEEKELLRKFIFTCEQHKHLLGAIDSDWEKVRAELIRDKEKGIVNNQTELGVKKEERDKLEHSTAEMLYSEEHILKECKYGLLGWKVLTWQARVKYTFTYDDKPFTRHDCVYQKLHYESKLKNEEKEKGKLTIKFKSHNRKDLNVKVKIFMQERHLPATIDRINLLNAAITSREAEIAVLKTSKMSLQSVRSKEELFQKVTKEFQEFRDGLVEVRNFFDTDLNPGKNKVEDKAEDKVTEWHAILGLAALFNLLEQTKAVHPGLSPANKNTFDEFLVTCSYVEKQRDNKYYRKIFPDLARRNIGSWFGKREDTPPLEPKTPFHFMKKITESIWQATGIGGEQPSNDVATTYHVMPVRQNVRNRLLGSDFVKMHQFETGICAVLLGILLWYETSNSSDTARFSVTNVIAIFAILIGAFLALSYARTRMESILTDVKKITEVNTREFQTQVKELLEEIEIETKKNGMTARNLGDFATRRLTEKFNVNVDVRTDIKGNLKTLAEVTGFRFL